MPSNYAAIRQFNKEEYGAGIGRWGKDVLAIRYDDRTHFIFELLQNAEDALSRRAGWQGSRDVSFQLADGAFRISHFGKLFDEGDVRGICGIAESTKDLTAIGRFGIGFKSVYAFTDRPEVHSGDEAFAIENFVWPTAVSPHERRSEETIIVLPLKVQDKRAREEIARGLQRIGPRTLLFLRQTDGIQWRVVGGPSGVYLRSKPEQKGENVRQVTVIGEEEGKPEIEETWLIFSRPTATDDGAPVGHVEIAFSIVREEDSGREAVRPVKESPLVVYFPTVLETHLGFLVQGPYRTTPSRDNVGRNNPWNQKLVRETAELLVEALRWLRDHDLLDTAALRCLPLDPTKFGEAAMFAPLFAATKKALSSEPLLPRSDTGHVPATRARLARSQELRELFTPAQLAALFGRGHEVAWLGGDITQDRTPELRRYLMQELDIAEVMPETIIPKLDKPFLQAQPDAWILDLYQFLNGQPAQRRRLEGLPLIRLEDGTHVPPRADGQPQAFLPGTITTEFPTVRASVCATETARGFLRSLGLTEPDPVDDVVRNVLPKYGKAEVYVSNADYEADIRRILAASGTDSRVLREKLVHALRETAFVMAVDAGNGTERVAKPGEVYLATERLKELFAGVGGVLLVDDAYSCLRGEDVRELLEACGATRHLQPIRVVADLSWEQRTEIRRNAGLERASWETPIADATVRGLQDLLGLVPRLDVQTRRHKAGLLWEALADLESRRGSRAFLGEYTWGYSHELKTATFDAAFVRHLNTTAWVPDANGELQRPELIVFDTLGWKPHPFLESKIRFKPPLIEALAREAGIEPGVLDLLKKLGVTSEAELRDRLGLKDEPTAAGAGSPDNVEDALKKLLGDAPAPTPPVPDPAGAEPSGSGGRGGGSGAGAGTRAAAGSGPGGGTGGSGQSAGRAKGTEAGAGKRTPGRGGRPFISYVAAHPDEEEPDSDGLDQSARMALEAQAIDLILSRESQWHRTPTDNPGYDLSQAGEDGKAARWCEVKAMTGGLRDRPIGLSQTQFECAQKHGEAYWLYVVEHAGTDSARIVRIQDPAGKARTFTFDHGWLSIADVDTEQGD